MATAKKLPSGSWRCLAYSHTETVIDEKTGKQKKKRIYVSFTSDDPTNRGRKEAELAASQFQAQNTRNQKKKSHDYGSMTVGQIVDLYIQSREKLGRSPTTIQEYKSIRDHAFPDLMGMVLKDLDEDVLQAAIDTEAGRSSGRWKDPKKIKPISAKRLVCEWGLVSSAIRKYRTGINYDAIELPAVQVRNVQLPEATDIIDAVRGSDIELPVLLAMWLSFGMSELRGLTKSESMSEDGNYIRIDKVMVVVDGKDVEKKEAKNPYRNRKHRIPGYIKDLIDQVPGDRIVPIKGRTLYKKWIACQKKAGIGPITFHDLRHVNASVMAILHIPDKYAQERGGWKTDHVMKQVYQNTFSSERRKVDNIIDAYFDKAMQHEMQHEKKTAQ